MGSVVRVVGLGVIRVDSGIKLVQHVRFVGTRSGLVEVGVVVVIAAGV